MKRILLIALLLFTGGVLADSEIYRWVDEDGNIHYSDCPPPAEEDCEAEIIQAAPEPREEDVNRAQEELGALMAEQEESKELRDRERQARLHEEARAEEQAVADTMNCVRARDNLRTLQVPRAVYHLNAEGERVYLSDEERMAEILMLQDYIEKNCEGPLFWRP